MRFRAVVLLGGKTATGIEVPADLAAALDGAPEAKRFFDGLSYSRRLRYVLRVEGAKKAETRQRRVGDTITRLANGEA
jgi:uncharacterized protein YdeI (YjbR/CyaY-like superfamily)